MWSMSCRARESTIFRRVEGPLSTNKLNDLGVLCQGRPYRRAEGSGSLLSIDILKSLGDYNLDYYLDELNDLRVNYIVEGPGALLSIEGLTKKSNIYRRA